MERITENLRQSEAQRKRSIPLRSTMYQAFMDYVNMAENQNAARTEYIQTMKAQLHSLAQLKVNIYNRNMFWSNYGSHWHRRFINRSSMTKLSERTGRTWGWSMHSTCKLVCVNFQRSVWLLSFPCLSNTILMYVLPGTKQLHAKNARIGTYANDAAHTQHSHNTVCWADDAIHKRRHCNDTHNSSSVYNESQAFRCLREPRWRVENSYQSFCSSFRLRK